jgi:hypothetical protein
VRDRTDTANPLREWHGIGRGPVQQQAFETAEQASTAASIRDLSAAAHGIDGDLDLEVPFDSRDWIDNPNDGHASCLPPPLRMLWLPPSERSYLHSPNSAAKLSVRAHCPTP